MPHVLFKGSRPLAENTIEWIFELAPEDKESFHFKAGQNVDITLPKSSYPMDDKGLTHTFSLSSSPNRKGEFTTSTHLSDSTFKKTMMDLAVGSPLEISNPGGQFTLPKSAEFPLVFIAGGVGITPFMSLVRYATEEKLPHTITLIYSNRSPESSAYLPELHEAVKANPHFTLALSYGPLTPELVTEKTKDLTNPTYYIAGPPGMVGTAHTLLRDKGVKEDDILIEEFSGYL